MKRVFTHEVREAFSFDEIHREEVLAIDLADLVNRHDIRVA